MTTCSICGAIESAKRSDTGKEVWYPNPSNSQQKICNKCQGKMARSKRSPVVHSEETKKKIGDAQRGEKGNGWGKAPWNKGKKNWMSAEGKAGVRASNLKRIDEIKARFTGDNNPSRRNGVWNKGKKGHLTDEQRKRLSDAHIGQIVTPEKIARMKEIMKIKAPWKGKKMPASACIKMSRNAVEREYHKVSKLEIKFADRLEESGIELKRQVPIEKISKVDIYIESCKLCVFVDGDWFHGNPKKYHADSSLIGGMKASVKWERDRKITDTLLSFGYKVLRLWELEIRSDLSGSIKRVREAMTN